MAAPQGVGSDAGLRRDQSSFRLVWWREVLLIVVIYALYTLIRHGVPARESPALIRAFDVIRIERALHIFHELALNRLVAAHRPLAWVFNYYYATAHFVVTIGVGVWVLWKHRRHARSLRTAWYAMTLFALVGYALYPLAPPRLVPGSDFVDTLVSLHTWGSIDNSAVAAAGNQYAAMPSLHVGWALWCAIAVCRLAQRRWVRVLGLSYPAVTVAVIIGTGNHFLLDAVAGAVALFLGFVAAKRITGRSAFTPEPGEDVRPPRIEAPEPLAVAA